MPFGIGSKHSNRSQPTLDDSLAAQQRASASQSNLNNSAAHQQPPQSVLAEDNKAYDPRTAQQFAPRNESGQQYIPTNLPPGIDPRSFHDPSETPSRSQSQRFSSQGYPPPSALINEGRPGPADEGAYGNVQKSYSTSGPNPRLSQQGPPPEQKKKKGFFGFSKKDKSEQAQPQPQISPTDYNNLGGLGRKASKSLKQGPQKLQRHPHDADQRQQLQHQQGYGSAQGSETHLPSTQEGEEGDREYEHEQYRQESEDFERSPAHQQGYDPRPHPSIRIARGDQDTTIRQVEESPTNPQYLEQQRFAQQQQRLVQHQAQLQQQQQQLTPVSAENPQSHEYPPAQQATQYPNQQAPGGQLYTNLPYRSTQNAEVVSQLSHESPTEGSEDQRPPSSATQGQLPGGYPSSPAEFPVRSGSFPIQQQDQLQPGGMAPPPGGSQNRRSTDAKSALGQGESRGPPPGYSQQFPGQGPAQSAGGNTSLPPLPGSAQQGNFRGPGLQRDFQQQGSGEQGRSTPPLPTDGSRSSDAAELEKLVVKYKKVKGLYFEKNAQVEQLQNTLANQRLSQSRTSLDDNEYLTRFNRLDGAIKEIAFSIRKDWRNIPVWLQPYVNADAQKIGTKEMTTVGRASISRWIFEEIFCKCFHPELELGLSADLKRMENNIRIFSSTPTNLEEENALTSKVIQWKLTTIDALADRFASPDAVEAKANYTRMAVSNLTAHLMNHLVDPAPQGIEGNATSIIELAVSICTHLPRESREISISYPLPGDLISSTGMKVETGLPPLENPMVDLDGEAASMSSGDRDEEEKNGKLKKQDKAKLLANAKKGSGSTASDKGDKNEGRVRFAAFMGVDVKGRQWLVNAPVWTFN